jgi:two-component system, chemotaxis family, protein-glutamate methylesterase/glutaminase
MIRVLVVDDSATMRAIIARTLQRDPGISVVGEAANPAQAREAIKTLQPDVLTLDVEMPEMNGIEFLEKIMRLRPMPVVMVSTLTSRGADASLRALELGAFDCVAKPRITDRDGFDQLAGVVRAAAGARMNWPRPAARPRDTASRFEPDGRLLAIGSSTGGVEALLTIIAHFPANCPPTVITQHMPATFTSSFAKRLDRCCAASVTEAVDGAPLAPGRVYLAPGGDNHLEVSGNGPWRCRLRASDLVNGHRPSVDTLFASVAKAAGSRALGVILTGMGRDGARGLLAMRQAGAHTLGQDEATSIVYGMPRAAFELRAVEKQVPLDHVAAEILAACNLKREERH